jgi:hypothetical protein
MCFNTEILIVRCLRFGGFTRTKLFNARAWWRLLMILCGRYLPFSSSFNYIVNYNQVRSFLFVLSWTKKSTEKNCLRPKCVCALGIEIKDFMKAYNMKSFNIDIRRFVTFGLVNNLIRRLHKFPISIKEGDEHQSPLPNIQQYIYFVLLWNSQLINVSLTCLSGRCLFAVRMIDGKHHYDEIAVSTGLSYGDIDTHFDQSVYR